MKKAMLSGVFATVLAVASIVGVAQEPKPYTEGPVVNVSYIKTKPGMFDAYMDWLATVRKPLMDEYKKAGLILDTRIYVNQPRDSRDPDIILTVTYKNYAALDGIDDKQEAVAAKVVGTRAEANKAAIDREAMREVLGSQTIRELVLK